jgi:hypothetical protein
MPYDVEIFATNDHNELRVLVSGWLKRDKPKQIKHAVLVADGAEYCYTVMFLFKK